MVREVLTINVGQAGIQLGQTIWDQYSAEHSIDHKGYKPRDEDTSFLTFFEETGSGQYIPRSVMVDTDPNIIDNIKNNKSVHQTLLSVSGKEDASNNFARGHYTVGKELISDINETLRHLVDNCDNVQGFMMNNAVGGGTGSGLGSLILERIAVDYRKKSKLGFHIYPFNNKYSIAQTETYNALLSTHWLLDHTEASLIFDNRKLHSICSKKLDIPNPTYNDLNCIISKVVSSMTASLRFEGELNVDLNEFQTHVYFPRLHFLTPSLAPIIGKQRFLKNKHTLVDGFVRHSLKSKNTLRQNWNFNYRIQQTEIQKRCVYIYNGLLYQDLMNMIYCVYDHDIELPTFTLKDIANEVVNSENFMIECLDFDAECDKYMKISLNFRGDIKAKEANAVVQQLKNDKKVRFVEWCPTGFKIGLNDMLQSKVGLDDCVEFKKINAVMIADNTCISRFFSERITKAYDEMYSQRAFVHWYVGEGMEEGELCEAREDLGFLEKDYLDVLTEQATDDIDDESD